MIVLLAVPFALGGVMWMLFLSQTHISVPALMGTLMCIGLTTANSILVVTFANQRMAMGVSPRAAAIEAGFTRLRPVLMTAGAMILGMIPMALGVGEGGEQNAPLARAVIGGLLFATVATLVFVPTMYGLLRRAPKELPARGSHPVHQPDPANIVEARSSPPSIPSTMTAADEPVPQHHEHIPVSTGYAKGTGRRLRFAAATLAIGARGGVLRRSRSIKGREEVDAGEPRRPQRAEEPPPVEVMKVDLAPPTQVLTLPGEARGWYTFDHLCAGQRVCGEMDRRHRGPGEEGSGAGHDRYAGARRPARRRASPAQGLRGRGEGQGGGCGIRQDHLSSAGRARPKGVVSEQEREDKKARYAVSIAQLNAARARVNLDQANVDRLTFLTQFKQVDGAL